MSDITSSVLIVTMLICTTILLCNLNKYDYMKSYDRNITDNLNKQIELNKLKIRKGVK